MTKYARITADGYVTCVFECDEPPSPDHIVIEEELPQSPPSDQHRLRKIDGVWQWEYPGGEKRKWIEIRDRRNQLLSACDWTQLQDVSIPEKQAWASYRQQLRDITLQADPFSIVWPIAPS